MEKVICLFISPKRIHYEYTEETETYHYSMFALILSMKSKHLVRSLISWQPILLQAF